MSYKSQLIIKLYQHGKNTQEIVKELSVTESYVYNIIRAYKPHESRLQKIKRVLRNNNLGFVEATVALSVENALELCNSTKLKKLSDAALQLTEDVYLKDESFINIDHIAMICTVLIKYELDNKFTRSEIVIMAGQLESVEWTDEKEVLNLIGEFKNV